MAEYSTIARPYAKAVFQVAQASNTFSEWSTMLNSFMQIADDERVRALFHDPKVKPEQLQSLFTSVRGVNDHGERFIKMLTAAKRLETLPEIARIYEELQAERQGSVHVEVLVSQSLTEDQKTRLEKALSKRFDRDVVIEEKVEPTLVAGARVKVGDTVWDASLRRRIVRLTESLLG